MSEPKVDPKEAEPILEQALSLQTEFSQDLCYSLKEKPDQIIGSPSNLEYSWVSVGQALIQIYQHITNNNLVRFSNKKYSFKYFFLKNFISLFFRGNVPVLISLHRN